MATVWLRLRADVRLGWRTLAALALLLGLVGGVVLTAAAGARRTDTAYPRLLSWASATQVDILPFSGEPAPGYYAAVARLPQVAAVSAQILYQIALPARHGAPQLVEAFSSPDGTMGVSADRVKIVQGRMFTSRAAGQAVIDPQLASLVHLRPGGTLHLLGIPDDPRTGVPDLSRAIPLAFRVTAIAVFDTQIVPANASFGGPMVLLSPPFTATRAARSIYVYGDEAGVRLRPGASMTAFLHDAETLARRFPATGGRLGVISLSDQVTATERAIRPQAVALAIFAVLAGLVGLAVIGQLLARQMALDSAEFPVLRTLGMTRASLAALALARLAAVTFAGAALAVGVAVAASPLMPIGPARLAEPAPGTEVNLAVLGAGLVAVAVLPLAVLVPAAWRAAGREGGPLAVAEPAAPARPSRLARVAGLAGSVPGSVGVRMAFEPGRGRAAVPVRSAVAGVIVAVAAVVAAVVFGASLITMVGTPRQYGQNWNQQLDLEFGAIPAGLGAKLVSADPAVTQYAAGDYGELTVDGKIVAAIGIDPVRGGGYLTLLSGRAPSAPGEIALGAQTLRALHRQVGQTVQVVVDRVSAPGPATQRVMRIVGVAVLPSFSRGGFASTDLGTGAVVPASVLSEPFAPAHCTREETCYNFFLFRYRPGTSLTVATARLSALATALGCPVFACTVNSDQRPADIRNDAAIRDTPLVLGAVLALLAVGTLAHVLLTGLHRRRRELAVLKTLGLVRSQLLRVAAWQATALAAAALVIGLPLGVLAGRWAWAVFAGSAGVSGVADVPAPLVLLTVPATLALANLIAAGPGWNAARGRPASVLRTELYRAEDRSRAQPGGKPPGMTTRTPAATTVTGITRNR
jgi:MacB-like periplasmic core domain/FtsX-like permease family